MTEASTEAEIRRTSARLRAGVSVLLACLALLLVGERFGAATLRLFQEHGGGDTVRRLAWQFFAAVPEALYLLALWWVRQALAAFAEERLYAPPVADMLDRVGITLAVAATIDVFLLPTVARALGFGPGYLVAYDISGLVLGAVGLSFRVIAHVLRRAAELRAELDEIF
jgi:hypothetical protein